MTVLQQELLKAQKAIDKSKKITEVQKVINENENLHKKILAQEEDFRLQNQTLLNELSLVILTFIVFLSLSLSFSQLVSRNEKLEKQTEASGSTTDETGLENAENVQYYRKELQREVDKNSNLQDEISSLRQKELERITDEFSLE